MLEGFQADRLIDLNEFYGTLRQMIFSISCIWNYLRLQFIFIRSTIYLDKAEITLDFILLDSRQAF